MQRIAYHGVPKQSGRKTRYCITFRHLRSRQVTTSHLQSLESPKDASSKSEKKKEPKAKKAENEPQELGRPLLLAKAVGEFVARKAIEKGISAVVFDRGGFKFHGRTKAVADGAREAGLKF